MPKYDCCMVYNWFEHFRDPKVSFGKMVRTLSHFWSVLQTYRLYLRTLHNYQDFVGITTKRIIFCFFWSIFDENRFIYVLLIVHFPTRKFDLCVYLWLNNNGYQGSGIIRKTFHFYRSFHLNRSQVLLNLPFDTSLLVEGTDFCKASRDLPMI